MSEGAETEVSKQEKDKDGGFTELILTDVTLLTRPSTKAGTVISTN